MSTGTATEIPTPDGGDRDEWEWSDEGLFVRDVDGRLIRYDKATREELSKKVTLKIDGEDVVIEKAVIATDEQGNIKRDEDGQVIPRPTTIYDAVTRRYQQKGGGDGSVSGNGQAAEGAIKRAVGQANNPIPILCHTLYMDPVAVCRVCVVQLARFRRSSGKIETDPKLLPACQHRVEDGMIVDTVASPDPAARVRIEGSVKTLLGLLMSDHPSPCVKEQQNRGDCELEALASRFGVTGGRFEKRPTELPRDDSSLVIAVDHNACILCDRCVRGCDVIKENNVIGRMGKGYKARIAFDIDTPMGKSSCVACGECMVSCPTGALTLKGAGTTAPGGGQAKADGPLAGRRSTGSFKLEGQRVTVDDLIDHPREEIRQAFQGVARPFLRWNLDAIVRRSFKPGEVICREGEFGRTAFMIENGSVEIFLKSKMGHVQNEAKRGILGGFGRFAVGMVSRSRDKSRESEDRRPFIPIDGPVALPYGKPVAPMGPGDIFGEMTCMSHYPRSATVVAVEECTVLEMLRNVLYIMQRNPNFRRELAEKYRNRAIDNLLRSAPLFAGMRPSEREFDEVIGRLRRRNSPRRCQPGEVIFREGAAADDGSYLVRSGFVKVSKSRPGGEDVLNYVGPGGSLGEVGALASLSDSPRAAAPAGVRTANCTALDQVDLIPIDTDEFRILAPVFARDRQFNDLVGRLRQRVSLVRFEPGEVIFRQGDRANDGVYLVRMGFVKVSESRPGGERVLNYVGPGGYVGEIGVLSEFPELQDVAPAGVRTATCAALDHVDLVRIEPEDFRNILEEFPAVRPVVVEEARRRLLSNSQTLRDLEERPLGDFLDQGLMNAEKLLVLDLEKCTRCDECTKACSDTHQGVTRLIREGLRFDKFLVASSCRSCLDPYCLVGCPVGSISRSPRGEILIADWCIGCTLCAENCPYGNINMVEEYDKEKKAEVRKATTCDLCSNLGPTAEPSCVYACPHDAAHRMKGTELLDLVRDREARGT